MKPERGALVSALALVAAIAGVVTAGVGLPRASAGPGPAATLVAIAPMSPAGQSPTSPPTLPPTVPPTLAPSAPRPPATASPAIPTPTPLPVRVAVDVRLVADPVASFASEAQKDWCSPATVQMVLAMRQRADTSVAFQTAVAGRVGEWSTVADSRNGGWGPTAIASAITAYGVGGYTVTVYQTRAGALRGAAAALSRTGSPVILLVWRGAHAWVMNGYRADADPTVFADATVGGVYIMDPWYPRVSMIWGRSDGPGVFQDSAEMVRNFLPWARPEGPYPERDGRYIIVAPTLPGPSSVPG